MWHVDTISTLSIILQWSSIVGISAEVISHWLVTSKERGKPSCGQTELPRVFSVSRPSSLSRRMRSLKSPAKALQGPHCGWLACTAARSIGNWPIRAEEQIHQPITEHFTCSAQISAALRPHAAHGLPLLQDSQRSEISKQRTFSANHLNWRHSLALRVLPCLELIYVIN